MEEKKIIRLYHAGNLVIENPDVHYGRKNADFGQGFYTSDDEEFSRRWARERKGQKTYVNVYDLDCSALKIRVLQRDAEWFRYIFANRRGKPDECDADVIIGPIANDTIYDTFGIFTSGFISDEDALAMLKEGPEYRQTVLKSEKAAQQLKWIEAEEFSSEEIREYRKTVAAEEEAYIQIITKMM